MEPAPVNAPMPPPPTPTHQPGYSGPWDQNRGDEPNEMGDSLPTVNLGSGVFAKEISAGSSHVCALLNNGSVKCWGYNGEGQLGYGDTRHRGHDPAYMGDELPVVDFGSGRTAISLDAGWHHTCVILDNGDIKCWGKKSSIFGDSDQTALGDAAGELSLIHI